MYLALALTFGFLAVTLALLGLMLIVEERRIRRRIAAVAAAVGPVSPSDVDAYVDYQGRGRLAKLMQPLTESLAALLPQPAYDALRDKVARAGLLAKLDPGGVLLLRIVFAVAGVAVGVLFARGYGHDKPLLAFVGALSIACVCAMLPDYWLQARINARQARIRKMLPDALDLLVVSVEAGTGLDGAIAHVERKFSGPVAEELGRALQEMRLGKPRAEALRAMARRTGLEEVSVFVSAVCQADQFGVSIAQVLRVQAETVREQRLHKIREMAQKLTVKLMFPTVLLIFPAIFVVILGPGVIRIYESIIAR